MDMYSSLDLNSQYTVKPKCLEIRLSAVKSCPSMTVTSDDGVFVENGTS